MAFPYLIEQTDLSLHPFPHFAAVPAIDPAVSVHLTAWLQKGVPWHLHKTGFYTQFECNLLTTEPPPDCNSLLDPRSVDALREVMSASFRVSLAKRQTVVAHKLLPGHQIGVHNDDPAPGMETHRLVMQFSAPDLRGGELLLHGSRKESDIHARFPSKFNSSVAFALSSTSYHSVTPVQNGIRYSIIFSFWAEDSLKPVNAGEELQGTLYYDALVSVLKAMGAENIPHSGRDLFGHLEGTAALLSAWGCSRTLCAAGLFHSVYGTESFEHTLVRTSEGPQLRSLLGEATERLVYLYSHAARKSVYLALRYPSAQPVVFDRLQQRETSVTDEQLVDLLLLDVANFAEQALHGEGDVQIDRGLAEHFAFLAPVMPQPTQRTLGKLGVLQSNG